MASTPRFSVKTVTHRASMATARSAVLVSGIYSSWFTQSFRTLCLVFSHTSLEQELAVKTPNNGKMLTKHFPNE